LILNSSLIEPRGRIYTIKGASGEVELGQSKLRIVLGTQKIDANSRFANMLPPFELQR